MLLRSARGIEEVERVGQELFLLITGISQTGLHRLFKDSKKIGTQEGCVMSQLGKRYRCQVCGTEILCTKAGEGNPVCCEKDMEVQEPKPLPSSD